MDLGVKGIKPVLAWHLRVASQTLFGAPCRIIFLLRPLRFQTIAWNLHRTLYCRKVCLGIGLWRVCSRVRRGQRARLSRTCYQRLQVLDRSKYLLCAWSTCPRAMNGRDQLWRANNHLWTLDCQPWYLHEPENWLSVDDWVPRIRSYKVTAAASGITCA
jgi:hypothetical protein